MSLCWQQIVFCVVAFLLVLCNVGTAQARKATPSSMVVTVIIWVALCLLVISI
ncbi:MAG: hypothetical protein E7D48_04025 [Bifidobacterium scardovii]|uniref:hypothetical protein n=1 Tax=Bifidobacterium scardovii TaxID=158787 RepID=UPI002901670A|nr:hypothetical protein [Bifidobacterium scardovii]MDU2421269.1 hypothetical protein [Bifidobacterium scardovii]